MSVSEVNFFKHMPTGGATSYLEDPVVRPVVPVDLDFFAEMPNGGTVYTGTEVIGDYGQGGQVLGGENEGP